MDRPVAVITSVSSALRYALWLSDQEGISFGKAMERVEGMTRVGEDGLREFLPEVIPTLPREAFPSPEALEGE